MFTPARPSEEGQKGAGKEKGKHKKQSVTWIVEVVSQVIFSATATVGHEIILGRDERCLSYGYPLGGSGPDGSAVVLQTSPAIRVVLQGNRELWNLPPFPSWELSADEKAQDPERQDEIRRRKRRRRRNVHLVILTHGMHSNTGADLLFMKEAIDAEARRTTAARSAQRKRDLARGKLSARQLEAAEEDDELVIVRGFHHNCCRTERGIKYLGKRLARYVLHLAHPKQNPPPTHAPNKLQKPRKPLYHPHLTPEARESLAAMPPYYSHWEKQKQKDSRQEDPTAEPSPPPFKITSISFIGHSLGGLIQTYALAYIHLHSPSFFTEIKPVNFVALATPFLGLSNENPIYVRFALDFGLVGRTGQDLGLTWRAPNAFSAFAGGAGQAGDHSAKPLLRILPTGPAHEVLQMFRHRTVYANVVNDGIVPLRTSCLLFLDWKGLGRVEKARRENGTVGGLVEWGWGQLVTNGPSMGVVSKVDSPTTPTTPAPTAPAFALTSPLFGSGFWSRSDPALEGASPMSEAARPGEPTACEATTNHSANTSARTGGGIGSAAGQSSLPLTSTASTASSSAVAAVAAPTKATTNPLSFLVTLLRPGASSSSASAAAAAAAASAYPKKSASRIYHRSQTESSASSSRTTRSPSPPPLEAPPRTSLLEATSDLLNPPLPSPDFVTDPSSRPRVIFHDRVYHWTDIPPASSRGLPVEEKIARAYHKDMSWRKVLVQLEPDAHNNMVVRRMFANAYGWPVVQHVVETHFGASARAIVPDNEQAGTVGPPSLPGGNGGGGEATAVPNPDAGPRRRPTGMMATTDASGGSWTSDAFLFDDDDDDDDDDDESEGEDGSQAAGDVGSVLESFLSHPSTPLPPPSPVASALGRGIAEVSRVSAEGHPGRSRGGTGGGGGEARAGIVSLGLRNLNFNSEGWGERRPSAEGLEREQELGKSEAVKMLKRCSGSGPAGRRESSLGRSSIGGGSSVGGGSSTDGEGSGLGGSAVKRRTVGAERQPLLSSSAGERF